jgi:hypothetical protein
LDDFELELPALPAELSFSGPHAVRASPNVTVDTHARNSAVLVRTTVLSPV